VKKNAHIFLIGLDLSDFEKECNHCQYDMYCEMFNAEWSLCITSHV